MEQPAIKPNNPNFSSGPCSKRPGWSIDVLSGALTGRSHRAGPCKEKLKEVIEKHRSLLGIPEDYLIGIVPASDTGAVEMALWSMLGARGVDVFAWESFSSAWLKDITDHLRLEGVRRFEADYGCLPDLSQADAARDIVFCWNGTTSGVRVPNANFIADDRTGITICDATSAVFAYDMPWSKLDVTTWSWQKVLGSEAAHGMIVLSPRAVERLENYVPENRPLPKIFRLTKKGKVNQAIFEGATINTPSMIAVEDCCDALDWVEKIGGSAETRARSQRNFEAVKAWVDASAVFDFLAKGEDIRSITALCLKVVDPWFLSLPDDEQAVFVKDMTKRLDSEDVAYDINSYRDAPAGIRIWGGATVETSNIEKLLPWLDWSFIISKSEYKPKSV